MTPSELEVNVLELGASVAGIRVFLPELVTRIKRLEEDRDRLKHKVEEQAAQLKAIESD